jgi:hypothetical protein
MAKRRPFNNPIFTMSPFKLAVLIVIMALALIGLAALIAGGTVMRDASQLNLSL